VAAIAILTGVLQKIIDMFALQQQAKLVEAELEALKDENASLISTKEKLEDPDYVQTYARGEYMFSKGDEKVFYLPGN
jgi:cell division protein DivIC